MVRGPHHAADEVSLAGEVRERLEAARRSVAADVPVTTDYRAGYAVAELTQITVALGLQ